VSITLSLVAVFIPVLLMGGVIGRVFNEFAVVVTASIMASAFVSLTLTPMMCSRFLKPHHEEERGLARWLGRMIDGMQAGYDRVLRLSLRHQGVVLLIFLGTLVASAWLFVTIPKGFFPQEDIGQLQVSTEARQDISFDAMKMLQSDVAKVFQDSPYVAHVASSAGVNTTGGGNQAMNQGRLFVELKPQDQRPPLAKVIADLRRQLSQVAGITAYIVPIQNLNVGGRASKSQFQFVMQAIGQAELYPAAQRLTQAMQRDAAFADVTSDLQNSALQATIVVDRDKARALGIAADQLRSTLYSGFGTRQVSTIYGTGDSYKVLIEFNPDVSWSTDRLDAIRIRASNGTLVPLSAFARVERTNGPLTVNQLGQLPAVTISFNLPPGVSLGQAVERIDQLKAELGLPTAIGTSFAGTAKVFQQSLANQGLLLLAAVLTIYIVLGILYESFIHPLTILTGLPSAGLGALLALSLFGMDLSVIAMIGLLMLIGIVKKNAIMMIDVALELQRSGLRPLVAIHRACLMRFRPIMMTTFAAIMGTLPIALGAGAGAELRQPLGIAVVGGLIVSQLLTMVITPVIFLAMDRVSRTLSALVSGRSRTRSRGPALPEGAGMPAE
jgi:HAE1 family hydrophobic/amphiphilic exporter-1